MRGRAFLCAITVLLPVAAWAQTPPKKDSVAKADSAARADSIALVRELEKELAAGRDTVTTAMAAPRAAGG